jgi:acetyl-CoA carboxylase biotin carboxyl carrier protein
MAQPTWADVLDLVAQLARSGQAEATIERPGLRLYVSTVDALAAESTVETRTPVRAPVMGTFYRRPAPDAAPFVEPGDEVGPDTTVAIVEVMKLMMPVTADVTGRVAEVCAEDGAMVEEGQPLFLIEARP